MITYIKKYFNAYNENIAHLIRKPGAFADFLDLECDSSHVEGIDILFRLHAALELEIPIEDLPTPSIPKKKETTMVKRMNNLNIKLERKQLILYALTSRRDRIQRGLYACHQLLEEDNWTPHEQKWIAEKQKRLTTDLKRMNSEQIVLLEAEIEGFKKELDLLQKEMKSREDNLL